MGTSYKDRLEGGYQLLRIRKFRGWTAAGLIAAGAGLVALSLAGAGATAKPLYMPIGAFLPALLVMVFVGIVLEMFFRNLSVKYAKKDSQRFLMIQNSMGRSKGAIAICLVIAVILIAPLTRTAADASATPALATHTLGANGVWAYRFDSQDGLGVTRYETMIVTLKSAGELDIQVTKDTTLVGGIPPITVAGRSVTISVDASQVYTYTVTFTNPTNSAVTFTYQMNGAVFPELFSLVPGFAIALLFASLGFYVLLRPRRERYEKAAIYSTGYQMRVDAGERLYSEYRPPAAVMRPNPVANPPLLVAAPPLVVSPYGPAAFNPGSRPVVANPVAPPPRPMPPTPSAVAPTAPSPSDIFTIGAAIFSRGEYEQAIREFDRALKLDPRHIRSLLAKGEALLRLGRTREALATYDQILRHDRANLDAFLGTAAVYAAERRWRDVIDLADTFLAIVPGDSEMLLRRGDAQLALGKRQEAKISYEAALLKRPTDPSILSRIEKAKVDIASVQSRALIASASGNLDQAIALFDEVLKVEPENANSLVGKSVALRRAGRVDEALASLNTVLARQAGHGGALLNKGRILEERGDLEDSLEAYDKLLELNSGDSDAWVAQGDVLAKMGRDDDALKSYREAMKLSPHDEDTQGKIASLEQARAEEGQVLRELFQIKGIGPAKAKALRDAGFNTIDDFRRATEDQLAQVRGITRKVASDILKRFQSV